MIPAWIRTFEVFTIQKLITLISLIRQLPQNLLCYVQCIFECVCAYASFHFDLVRSVILSLTPTYQQVAHIFYIKGSILHWTCHLSVHWNWCVFLCTLHCSSTQLNYIHTLINQNMWLIFYTFLFVRCMQFSFRFFPFLFFSFGFIVALFIFERVPVAVSNVGARCTFWICLWRSNLHTHTNRVALSMATKEMARAMCRCEIRKWQFGKSRRRIWRQSQMYTKTSHLLWCTALFSHHVENLYSFFFS